MIHEMQYTAEDEHATEVEVAEFLYALVRLLKPEYVAETGCYKGQCSEQLARALNQNCFGEMWSCDPDEECLKAASARIKNGTQDTVFMNCHGETMLESLERVDFVFIDGGSNVERIEQFHLAKDRLGVNGVIAMHDTAQPRFVGMDTSGMREFSFSTPRGITLYQKV